MGNPWIVDANAPDAAPTINLVHEYIDEHGDAQRHPLWLKVRAELSVGEHRRMLKSVTSLSQAVRPRGAADATAEARFEWTEYSFARMEAYIIDWSLAHEPNLPRLKPTRVSYEALREEVFDLIDGALDAHEQVAADRKKARATSPKPDATSA